MREFREWRPRLSVWEVNHVWPGWAIPSRNGKYLAILAPTADSNVWMATYFSFALCQGGLDNLLS